MPKRIYIAGPMRGIPLYNFPAFDAAAKQWRAIGWEVVNPAELDRAAGVTEHTQTLPPNFLREAMERDLAAICRCDTVALLPGWEKSTGVSVELALAKALALTICNAEDGTPVLPPAEETITAKAERITSRSRRDVYGHPFDDFTRIGIMWGALLGIPEVTPEQVGACMVALKLGRLCHSPGHRNSLVDIAGYANCLDFIRQRRMEAA